MQNSNRYPRFYTREHNAEKKEKMAGYPTIKTKVINDIYRHERGGIVCSYYRHAERPEMVATHSWHKFYFLPVMSGTSKVRKDRLLVTAEEKKAITADLKTCKMCYFGRQLADQGDKNTSIERNIKQARAAYFIAYKPLTEREETRLINQFFNKYEKQK